MADPAAKQERPDLFSRIRRNRVLLGTIWTAEQIGKLAIIWTAFTYFQEAPERRKQKEFQAWQLVNSAKSGDGGRKLALHDLVVDDVDLSGVDLRGANLIGADLRGGRFERVDFSQANVDNVDFSCRSASWYGRILHREQDCKHAVLDFANFTTPITGANMRGASLSAANFSVGSIGIKSISDTSFDGAIFDLASFNNIFIKNTSFAHSSLNQATFKNVCFSQVSFDNANISSGWPGKGPMRYNAPFEGASFDRVTFAGANLFRVTFLDSRIAIPYDPAPGGWNVMDACYVPKSTRALSKSDFAGAHLCEVYIGNERVDQDCKR